MQLTIQRFAKDMHDRSHFDCGVQSLNHFIRSQVSQDARRNLNRCYVATPAEGPARILGYYTISSHSVVAAEAPPLAQHQPYPAIPAALVGRLAVCASAQGKGVGKQLLADAIRRLVGVHCILGISLIVVDPLGEDVTDFYSRFGFRELASGRLYLPVKTAIAAVDAARGQERARP